MIPTLGRIVIFHDKVDQVRQGDWPAIVLGIDVDGDNARSLRLGVFSDLGYGYVAGVREGLEVGCWSWPIQIVDDRVRFPR